MPDTQVTLQPDPDEWWGLLERGATGDCFGESIDTWRSRARAELGLPVGHRVVATGHQAAIWHPGILAKYLAVDALAERLGADKATACHLVVDQDANDFGLIDYPRAIGSDQLELDERVLFESAEPGRSTGVTPASPPRETPQGDMSRDVEQGIARIVEALQSNVDAASVALQLAAAVTDLMSPWVQPMVLVTASGLLGTSFGEAVLDEMARAPERCVACYNGAVRASPEVGVALLARRGLLIELPLWVINRDGTRRAAFADDLDDDDIGRDRLLPRALLMTALARLVMCDLFVHGKGGTVYDQITEGWIGQWLGLTLASMVMASADVFLTPARVREAEPVSEAIAAYRRMLHDPDRDSGRISPAKVKHLHRLATSRGFDRRAAFFEMHQWLKERRGSRHHELEESWARIELARQDETTSGLLSRRDWPFPLYSQAQIDELARLVQAPFIGVARKT